jgi:CMP-N,N'-diacetyllegionaminic acid synthase
MYNGKHIVGIIPARGGSKGLPRKNILLLKGKPLIAWSIEQAKTSKYLDKIIVSTDDVEIAAVARQYGADVPFLRPKELASDSAKTIDVIMHTLNWLETHNEIFDLLVLLQPTSPLRVPDDINSSIELLFSKKAKAVISVCETEHHPYWSNVLPADGSMNDFLRPEIVNSSRQELPTFYRLNGAIYCAFWNYVRNQHGFFGKYTYAYIMPKERSIDIDTKMDFEFAEVLLQKDAH